MKIALIYDVSFPFSKGGGESRYYYLAKSLIKEGHTVTWFSLKNWKKENTQINYNGITYQSIGREINSYNSSGRRSLVQTLYFSWRVLLNLYKIKNFDIIDTPQYPFFHIIPLLVYRKKLVVTWFEYWDRHWFEYTPNYFIAFWGYITESFIAKLPKHMICISKKSMNSLLQYAGRSKNHTILIPNWIDYNNLLELNPKKGENCYDISYFGRLKNHKRVDVLIKAIKICADNDKFYKLMIFGDGPERKNLFNLIHQLNLQEDIRLHGYVDSHRDLLKKVSKSNLFVLPSNKEGGGSIVTLEANSVGVPVLAIKSELGIDNSLIKEDYNGFWCNGESPEALSEKIMLIHDRIIKNRNYFRINCNNFAANYDIDYLSKDVLNCYNRVQKGIFFE
jgi:L-malate glycosyltransferase